MNIKPKILIADDEVAILHVITIKLKKAGYTVVSASNGIEAYETAIKEQPDLIVTDYNMPGLSGLEVCCKLKHNILTKDIPTIMLTSHSFELSQDKLEKNGIVKCMDKPFSPRELLEEIDKLTENLIPTAF